MAEFITRYELLIFLWSIGVMFTIGYAFMTSFTKVTDFNNFLISAVLSILMWPIVLGVLIGGVHSDLVADIRNKQ